MISLIASQTRSGSTSRMHRGLSNARHLSPGHGWQSNLILTTRFGADVHGFQWTEFEEPKITTVGVSTAAAICAIPLSFPTNKEAREAKAVTSGKTQTQKAQGGPFKILVYFLYKMHFFRSGYQDGRNLFLYVCLITSQNSQNSIFWFHMLQPDVLDKTATRRQTNF